MGEAVLVALGCELPAGGEGLEREVGLLRRRAALAHPPAQPRQQHRTPLPHVRRHLPPTERESSEEEEEEEG